MYLQLGVRVKEEDVHRLQLLDVSVPFVLLPDLGPDGGDGEAERVHLLDFRSL